MYDPGASLSSSCPLFPYLQNGVILYSGDASNQNSFIE